MNHLNLRRESVGGVGANRFRQIETERSAPARRDSRRSDRRLLLVESDDATAGKLVKDLHNGHLRVIRTRTAALAYQAVMERAFDLVIAAVNLPDESGWLLTCKLLSDDPQKRIWLYGAELEPRHHQMADFIGAERLVDSRNINSRLSAEFLSR